MDPLSELQDDLTLDDSSEALNQLKLASIDEKNWPSDEMPEFPKSGGRHWSQAAPGPLQGKTPVLLKGDCRRAGWGQTDQTQGGAGSTGLTGGRATEHVSGRTLPAPRLSPDFAMFLR